LTATATVDESGTVTIDLLLTGRTPRRAGSRGRMSAV
jgi:hypothetical protein